MSVYRSVDRVEDKVRESRVSRLENKVGLVDWVTESRVNRPGNKKSG